MNYDILDMQVNIGNETFSLTFNTLHISKDSIKPKIYTPNNENKPFLDRFRLYSTDVLSQLQYHEIVEFFFDRTTFQRPRYYKDIKTDNKDDYITRQNIYLTLFYLFPTGFPTTRNIHFSSDIISGKKESYDPVSSGFAIYDIFKKSILSNPILTKREQDINKTQNTENKKEQKNNELKINPILNLFRSTDKRFSYISRGSTINTISQVVWKNDIYNHPIYAKLLTNIYNYLIGCYQLEKKDIFSNVYNTCLKVFFESSKSMITSLNTYADTKISGNSNSDFSLALNFPNLIKLVNLYAKESLKINKNQDSKVQKEHLKNILKDFPETYNIILPDIIKNDMKIIKDLFVTDKESEVKTLYMNQNRDNNIYNNFVKNMSNLIFIVNLKQALQKKTIVSAVDEKGHLYPPIYKESIKDIKELNFIHKLYNDCETFKNELQGESSNSDLNKLITDFTEGKIIEDSTSLTDHAIFYRYYLFNDRSIPIDNFDKTIKDKVIKNNEKWRNIYTGIRREFQGDIKTKSGVSNSFTIYLSMNVYDQELNNETAYLFKCFLLNNELGRRMEYQFATTKRQHKELINSEIKHIPMLENKSLSQVTEEKKKKDAEDDKKKEQEQKLEEEKKKAIKNTASNQPESSMSSLFNTKKGGTRRHRHQKSKKKKTRKHYPFKRRC